MREVLEEVGEVQRGTLRDCRSLMARPGDPMRRRNLVSSLFRTVRLANDFSVRASDNPRRITRRAKNKRVGRLLGRAGVWRMLWR